MLDTNINLSKFIALSRSVLTLSFCLVLAPDRSFCQRDSITDMGLLSAAARPDSSASKKDLSCKSAMMGSIPSMKPRLSKFESYEMKLAGTILHFDLNLGGSVKIQQKDQSQLTQLFEKIALDDGNYIFVVTDDHRLAISPRFPGEMGHPAEDKHLVATHLALYEQLKIESTEPKSKTSVIVSGRLFVSAGVIWAGNTESNGFRDFVTDMLTPGTLLADTKKSPRNDSPLDEDLIRQILSFDIISSLERYDLNKLLKQPEHSREAEILALAKTQFHALRERRSVFATSVLAGLGIIRTDLNIENTEAVGTNNGHLSFKSLIEVHKSCTAESTCKDNYNFIFEKINLLRTLHHRLGDGTFLNSLNNFLIANIRHSKINELIKVNFYVEFSMTESILASLAKEETFTAKPINENAWLRHQTLYEEFLNNKP